MSEPFPGLDRRAPAPSRVSTTAAYGLTAGLGLATIHWFVKLFDKSGNFHFALPEDALLEMWIATCLPTAHLICRIVNNRLSKLAGENA